MTLINSSFVVFTGVSDYRQFEKVIGNLTFVPPFFPWIFRHPISKFTLKQIINTFVAGDNNIDIDVVTKKKNIYYKSSKNARTEWNRI